MPGTGGAAGGYNINNDALWFSGDMQGLVVTHIA